MAMVAVEKGNIVRIVDEGRAAGLLAKGYRPAGKAEPEAEDKAAKAGGRAKAKAGQEDGGE